MLFFVHICACICKGSKGKWRYVIYSSRELLEHLQQSKSADHIGRCFLDEVNVS